MDFSAGDQLIVADTELLHELLGKTHAMLHKLNPSSVIKVLDETAIDKSRYALTSQFTWLREKAVKYTWMNETADWLESNRPNEPERLSVCHRDFHAMNVLYAGNEVTGIIDWSGFLIADPVFDVANTKMLLTIPGKYLINDFKRLGATADWIDKTSTLVDLYLDSYQQVRELDHTQLEFYTALRCATVIMWGVNGSKNYRIPGMVKEFIEVVRQVTGVSISLDDVQSSY